MNMNFSYSKYGVQTFKLQDSQPLPNIKSEYKKAESVLFPITKKEKIGLLRPVLIPLCSSHSLPCFPTNYFPDCNLLKDIPAFVFPNVVTVD